MEVTYKLGFETEPIQHSVEVGYPSSTVTSFEDETFPHLPLKYLWDFVRDAKADIHPLGDSLDTSRAYMREGGEPDTPELTNSLLVRLGAAYLCETR